MNQRRIRRRRWILNNEGSDPEWTWGGFKIIERIHDFGMGVERVVFELRHTPGPSTRSVYVGTFDTLRKARDAAEVCEE